MFGPSSHLKRKKSKANRIIRHSIHLKRVSNLQEIGQVCIQIFILRTIELAHLLDHLNEVRLQLEVVCHYWGSNNATSDSLHVWSCVVRNTSFRCVINSSCSTLTLISTNPISLKIAVLNLLRNVRLISESSSIN